jgi:serine/threonine-protein kinase
VSAVDARIGSELAGYRIEQLIARGGMAAVYLAEHLRLRRKVALKLLAPELAADERFQERFLRESQLAASLDHPNIVPIHDADEAEGVLYIAMRYVEGGDLRDLLQREGPLDPGRAVRLLSQAAAGLDAAHRRGLVHRDVKPGNLLLGEDEHLYVSDFGLTKQASSQSGLTATGQLVGTVDYVAPEQIRGEQVDRAADVYSLACVLYELLAGAKPFVRDTEVAIIWAHMQDPAPSLAEKRPELPRSLDDVLAKGMAKEPSARYATCRELVDAARRELGVSSGEISSPVAGRRRVDRRWLVAAGIAAAALAAAAVAVLVTQGDTSAALAFAPPNSLAVIDAKTNELVDAIAVGKTPADVVAADGTIWVANRNDQTLSRIDAATGKLRDTIGAGLTPRGLAVGGGAVWTTDRAVVVRRSLAFDESRTIQLKGRNITGFGGVLGLGAPMTAGAGAIWIAHSYSVERLDSATGEIRVVSSDLGGSPTALVVRPGSLWVGDAASGAVVHINPGTRLSKAISPGPGAGLSDGDFGGVPAIGGVAAGAGAIWATVTADDRVVRIDPQTEMVTRRYRVGDRPNGIAYGEGAVWTANTDGTVSRIDPGSGRVAKIHVGGTPTGLAVARGRVWVSVQR